MTTFPKFATMPSATPPMFDLRILLRGILTAFGIWLGCSTPLSSAAVPSSEVIKTASRLIDEGRADSALVMVRRGLERDSTSAALWLSLADVQLARKNDTAHVDALYRALRLRPHSTEAHLALAEYFIGAGQFDSLAVHAHAVLGITNGGNALASYFAGRVHDQRGEADSAIVYYRRAWVLLPAKELF